LTLLFWKYLPLFLALYVRYLDDVAETQDARVSFE